MIPPYVKLNFQMSALYEWIRGKLARFSSPELDKNISLLVIPEDFPHFIWRV